MGPRRERRFALCATFGRGLRERLGPGASMYRPRVVPNHERGGERAHERHGEHRGRARLNGAHAIDGRNPALTGNFARFTVRSRGFIGRGSAGGAVGDRAPRARWDYARRSWADLPRLAVDLGGYRARLQAFPRADETFVGDAADEFAAS